MCYQSIRSMYSYLCYFQNHLAKHALVFQKKENDYNNSENVQSSGIFEKSNILKQPDSEKLKMSIH